MFAALVDKLLSSVVHTVFHVRKLVGSSFLSGIQSSQEPPPSGVLHITDSRTNQQYKIPIHRNAIEAVRFKEIRAPKDYHHPADKVEGGLRVLDQGFQNTAVMKSEIAYVDGMAGTIHYREFPISELVGKKQFEDVTFLLIWGHLPSADERSLYKRDLAAAMAPPKMVTDCINSFPYVYMTFNPDCLKLILFPSHTTPLVTMVIAGMSAWAGSDPTVIPAHMGRNIYQGNLPLVDKQIVRVLSALGTVVALSYCRFSQKSFTPADPNGSFIENMLIMMGYIETTTGRPSSKYIDCLERLWVLYADHELTNSTAAFLHVASTLADPFTCSIASITAAYGPLHGGAIETAFKTIKDVGKPENVPRLIEDVKAKKFRLFGYGHRIYKTVDPRSVYIREYILRVNVSLVYCR